jgi:hypothetical protein
MAKPINPYQGPAPAAMSQMGQGLLEVGANIGRTLQKGYESMGQGIASGITAVADAYKQSKEDEAKFNATKKMFKAFGGALDETQRKEIDGIFADTSMSVREKNALAPTLMQYLGAAQQQNQALAKQQQELNAAAARQREQIASQEMMPFRQQAASLLFGAPGSSAGLAPQNFSIQPTQPTQPTNMFGGHY